MKSNSFVKGAVVLILFNLVGKVLGAVYRIPLAGILGTAGMGKYQLIFPLYSLILTISTSGIPVAISKLVSEYNAKNQFAESRKLLKISILILSALSVAGTFAIVFGAKIFASIQGNPDTYVCYYGIAPAILFVGMLSAFRGYFQGNLLMFPTAFSGFVEQLVKMATGLFLAKRFLIYGIEYAVLGAVIGISISELFACLFLFATYLIYSKKHKILSKKADFTFKYLSGQLVSMSAPITIGGLVSPITAMVDSLLVVNILIATGYTSEMATMMLGIQAGIVEPIVSIPTILSISIATALLPSVSKLESENSSEKIKKMVEKAVQISLSLSLAFFVCFIIFGKQIMNFLYGSSLDIFELNLAVKLLFAGSINIVFLSVVQILSSVLQALGHQKYPVKSLLIGCTIKIVLDVCLISVRKINVLGAVISGGVCYFVVMLLNYKKVKEITGINISNVYFYVSIQECFVCLFAFFVNALIRTFFSEFVAMIVAGSAAVAVFFVTYYVFFVKQKNEGVDLQST